MRRLAPLTLALSVLVTSLLGALLTGAGPAYAEAQFCSGKGVSVVVDFQSLGGGVQRACDQEGAGKTAQQVFTESGFQLTPVGAFPGAACKVDGKPADTQCAKMPPADAYWGLFLNKGTSWDYAPKGADQLRMKDGDFIGFSWQSSKTPSPPGAQPVAASASPRTASPQTGDNPSSSTQQQAEDEGGFPWWVPVVVVVLLVAAAAVAVRRRRRASDG